MIPQAGLEDESFEFCVVMIAKRLLRRVIVTIIVKGAICVVFVILVLTIVIIATIAVCALGHRHQEISKKEKAPST